MRFWTEEGHAYCEPDTALEWLEYIHMLGFDYDGCQSSDELKGLIDEILEMAKKARMCIGEGKIY